MFTKKYAKEFIKGFFNEEYQRNNFKPEIEFDNTLDKIVDSKFCFDLADRYLKRFTIKDKILAATWLLESSPKYLAAKTISKGNIGGKANIGQYIKMTKYLDRKKNYRTLLPPSKLDKHELTGEYLENVKIKREKYETLEDGIMHQHQVAFISGTLCEYYNCGYRGADGDWKPSSPTKQKFRYITSPTLFI